MADVFLCHASEDRATAEAIVAALENAGVGCWIAPRDVAPGTDYAQAIIAGLSSSRMLVLVLSAASNDSPHVRREVERAVSRDLVILPVRVEEISPSRSLEYYISDTQWFEAPGGDIAGHAHRLVETVQRRLTLGETVIAAAAAPPVPEDLGPVEAALFRLVDRYGPGLGSDPRRVGALLRDLAGERRSEIAAVVAAAEEGVPEGLGAAGDTMTAATIRRLTDSLRDNRALAPKAAESAVRAWATALGVHVASAAAPPPAEQPRSDAVPPTEHVTRHQPPREAVRQSSPPQARRPSGLRRLAPILGVGGAVAAVVIAVAVTRGGDGGGTDTLPPVSSTPSTAPSSTTSATGPSTTDITTATTVTTGAVASSPVTDSTGTLSTVRPNDWDYSQFDGHIYSAVNIDDWTAEYNERGWKTEAHTPGFRLSLFTDDRASDSFMQQVLNGSEVPANCDFDGQAPSQLSGEYSAWVNSYSCDGGGTYELWTVWEPAYPSYFVVFEAYYVTTDQLDAVQQAFASSLWIRP
ncbi:MAG: toll/interleukin-1 receptor domain-containing protein [Acidimicrobiia bacterium]